MRSIYMSSVMNMSADIFEQENSQDSTTGAILRTWKYQKTIKCHLLPQKSSGASVRSDGKKFNDSNGKYTENLQLRGKFTDKLSKRWRISNIKTSDNQIVFTETDIFSENPTIFEVVSCHPMTDPFGRFVFYDVTLERVNVQDNVTS